MLLEMKCPFEDFPPKPPMYLQSTYIKDKLLVSLILYRYGASKDVLENRVCFNPIQDGGQKSPPTNLFPVNSANIGISPQNFLNFSFNSFATLVQNFKATPSASAKLLRLNQGHPLVVPLVKSL